MRVLLVTGEYPPAEGGVAGYTRCLGEALVGAGLSVHVATSGRGGESDEGGIAVHRTLPDWGWRSLGRLSGLARETGADILHIQYQAAAYSMRPAIHLGPWWLDRRTPIRTAVTFHDLKVPYLFPKAGSVRRHAVRALARWSDLAVVTNAPDFAELAAWRGARRLALVPIGSNVPDAPPPGYERQAWRTASGLGSASELVAYFGLLNASKGALTLVESMTALVRAGRDVRLVMIGGQVGASDPTNVGYLDRFRGEIAARGLGERVIWTGHVPPPEVSAWLHAADVVALPYEDGASFRRGSLLAALEHGAAIVTTRPSPPALAPTGASVTDTPPTGACPPDTPTTDALPPGAPRPLVDGVSARLVPAGDAPAFAHALSEVLADRDLRERLSAGARTLAQDFGWPGIAARHAALYREIT